MTTRDADRGHVLSILRLIRGKHAPDAEALLTRMSAFTSTTLEMLQREGYVFARFPRNLQEQPPVTDGERWEALAFSLYSDMAQASSDAEQLLIEIREARSASVASQPPQEEK